MAVIVGKCWTHQAVPITTVSTQQLNYSGSMLFQNNLFYIERFWTIVPSISYINNMTINRLLQTRTISRFRIFLTTTKNYPTLPNITINIRKLMDGSAKPLRILLQMLFPITQAHQYLQGKMQTYTFTNVTALAKRSILLLSRINVYPLLYLTYIYGSASSCSLFVDIIFVLLFYQLPRL